MDVKLFDWQATKGILALLREHRLGEYTGAADEGHCQKREWLTG